MDPVAPWIDAEAVRRLARQLVEPPRVSQPAPPEDPGFGPGFEGFLVSRAVAADALPADEPPAKPFLSSHQQTPSRSAPPAMPEESSPDRGPLISRMERFRDWLIRNVDARGAFILDREGEPVLDDPAYSKLYFLARSLAQAYRPVRGEVGNVHVKVGSGSYLAVVPVDTAFGRLVLGTVLPEPLDAESVAVLSEALGRAARPDPR